MAAGSPPKREPRRLAPHQRPGGLALVGLALLVYDHFDRLNTVALLLSAATLMAVVLRMAVAFRAHAAMLESSRREAVTDALTGPATGAG